jgi:hypothetical protein
MAASPVSRQAGTGSWPGVEDLELAERGRALVVMAVELGGCPRLSVVPPVQAKAQEDADRGTTGCANWLATASSTASNVRGS